MFYSLGATLDCLEYHHYPVSGVLGAEMMGRIALVSSLSCTLRFTVGSQAQGTCSQASPRQEPWSTWGGALFGIAMESGWGDVRCTHTLTHSHTSKGEV